MNGSETMSKRSSQRRAAAQQRAKDTKPNITQPAAEPQQAAQDAYSNPAANIGYGTESMAESVEYQYTRETLNYMQLIALYRGSGILKRIVNKPIEDACAHWLKIDSQITPDQKDAVERCIKQTGLKKKIETGLKWGRLFGGAAGLIMIDGQGDMLDQPLDVDSIEPGSFKGIYIVDRWSGIYPDLNIVDDIGSSAFGLPEYYQVRTSENGAADMKVHNSRIVRFQGEELPYWDMLAEQYWGASIIETVLEELKQYDNTRFNIANLLFQANVWVQKSDDLEQMIAMGSRTAQNKLWDTLHAQSVLRSSFHAQIIGKEDDLSTRQYSFAGLKDVFEVFMYALSSVTGIPITILFGRSPGGMDATGDADMDNYYSLVEGIQENRIRPPMEQLLPIICMSEFGAVPDDINPSFNPVRIPTEKEKSDIAASRTTAILAPFTAGATTQATTLKELKNMSDSTGMWGNITDEDIEQADNVPDIGDVPPQNDLNLENTNVGGFENDKSTRSNT
jgi:phage-related protein (TIGR01555 family)